MGHLGGDHKVTCHHCLSALLSGEANSQVSAVGCPKS